MLSRLVKFSTFCKIRAAIVNSCRFLSCDGSRIVNNSNDEAFTHESHFSHENSNSELFREQQKFSKIDEFGRAYGTGRRKSSIARVWIKPGSGEFTINHKKFVDYFQPMEREHTLMSLILTETAGLVDVWCTVKGGGISGNLNSNLNSYLLFIVIF